MKTLARSSMTRDGGKFFFETRDALLPADTNGVVDIYMATPNDDFVVRLSATENGLPETGAAYDPVVTPDGSTVFFISNRRLRVSDNDGRATIYRWLSRDSLTPTPSKTRHRVIDKAALKAHVIAHPDVLLRERALEFSVTPSGLWRAMRALGLRKKNDAVRGKSFR